MRICDYCHKKEGKYYFPTVDKWCCENSQNKCPEIRKKLSIIRKGNIPWNKNIPCAEETKNKISKSNKKNNRLKIINNYKEVKHSGIICDYGCGREAKYQFKNGKWCCERTTNKCIEVIRKNSKKQKGKSGYWKGKKRESFTQQWRDKISKKNKRSIKKIQKKFPFFSKIEEMRYNPNKNKEKEIQVHCKNHNCINSKERDGWFVPTGRQLEARIWSLENGEDTSNFYCSKECKKICPMFNLKSDPYKNTENPYTNLEYQIWRKEVLKRDNYKCVGYDGHYCGESAEHVHHIYPVKTHPELALDPDNGISLCIECHKYIHKKGTECSTGQLANKIC